MPHLPRKLTFTVLVPSYRRPQDLLRCLQGLLAGSRPPDEIVVVLRDVDRKSQRELQQWLDDNQPTVAVRMAMVSRPGQIAAMNRGLQVASGDIVCFTDDDCVPRSDWLERLAAYYADEAVGGVGGHDVIHYGNHVYAVSATVVGRITWWGRIIGNHHCEFEGAAQEVDHLKGANMSFRRTMLREFDENLAGGSSCLNDTEMSLWVRQQGGKLIYDPRIVVDHYPAERFGESTRKVTDPSLVYSDSHNWVYCMLKYMSPIYQICFFLYALSVGMGTRYGLLKYLMVLPRGPWAATRQFWAATRGKLAGLYTYWRWRVDRHDNPETSEFA